MELGFEEEEGMGGREGIEEVWFSLGGIEGVEKEEAPVRPRPRRSRSAIVRTVTFAIDEGLKALSVREESSEE